MDKQENQLEVVSANDVHRLLAVGKILVSVLTPNEIEVLQACFKDHSEIPSYQPQKEFTEIQIGNTSVT